MQTELYNRYFGVQADTRQTRLTASRIMIDSSTVTNCKVYPGLTVAAIMHPQMEPLEISNEANTYPGYAAGKQVNI